MIRYVADTLDENELLKSLNLCFPQQLASMQTIRWMSISENIPALVFGADAFNAIDTQRSK